VNASCWIDPEELIKEVADELERLNNRPTSVDKCHDAYQLFQGDPTEETREKLREAYEAAPEHNRRFVLGDMDVKDIPIRMIIYGEKEIENWSHWQVAKQQGIEPLPSIKVKKVRPKGKNP
jgi:Ni,Fe-hydrogenase III small subunit